MTRIELVMEIEAPVQRCFDLARSIEVHLLGTGSSREQAIAGVTTGLIGMSEFVRWRAKHLGFWQHLASRITAFDSPTYFQDTMMDGAFASMQHDHFFTALAENRTSMRDVFVFAAPVPLVGRLVEALVLRRYMTEFLRKRNLVLKRVAESSDWRTFLPASYRE